ncbi:hypothetical protein [Nocardia farcinica]|nr:hypothetical protein [Nocardia farcinica]
MDSIAEYDLFSGQPLHDAIQLPCLADLVNAPTEGKKSTYTITGITSIPR